MKASKSIYNISMQFTKGARCSVQGKHYEERIATLCRTIKSIHLDKPFNTQYKNELGGCSAGQDVYVNFREIQDIGVEVKRMTPDWMQMSIIPGVHPSKIWNSTSRSKIPLESKTIFTSLLSNLDMFPAPPFLQKEITYEEWLEIKTIYKDRYLDIPNDTLSRAYNAKGTQYIQLLNYGLYHTGDDLCNFQVPFFECEQRLRVRCKRHGKKDALGNNVPSSVMASLCPKLKTLPKSPYSLDNIYNLPPGLVNF